MAHTVEIKEIENGVQITETIDTDIVVKLISYQSKPFLRTTNETDEETYQVIDKVGEIYNIPAIATDFIIIDKNDAVFIPADGIELIEYSKKIRAFRPDDEIDTFHIGNITTTSNSLTINLADDNVNWAYIDGSFYEKYYPDTFNFTPVTTGEKILIVYALPDSQVFHLAQGAESTEAVEPNYSGLFVARLLVTAAGIDVEIGFSDLWEAINNLQETKAETNASNISPENAALWLNKIFSEFLTTGKIRADKIESLAILDLVIATETTIANFAAASGSYTFQKNDLIAVPDGSGKYSFYIYTGGTKTDVASYLAMGITNVTISQVVGLQTALDNLQSQITANTTAIANEAVKRIEITTTTSITTNTVGSITGKGQHGRHVQIKNGVNAINIECRTDSAADFMASYEHLGSADITFTAGSGATVTDVYGGTKVLKANGTCAVTRNGNTFKLYIP